MQLSFTEAEGRISWEAKLAKKKKNYVERFSSQAKGMSPPSKRFRVETELLKPAKGKEELEATLSTRSRKNMRIFTTKRMIEYQKAVIWAAARSLKKLEAELRIVEELRRRGIEKDMKDHKERCEVLWQPLSNLEKISFTDVVALEKKILDNILGKKRQTHRGSPNEDFDIVHCEIPLEIRYNRLEHTCNSWISPNSWGTVERHRHWSDPHLRFSYHNKHIKRNSYAFTAHITWFRWKRKTISGLQKPSKPLSVEL